MATNYNVNVKNARLAVVRDAIDAGAGPGYIEIGTVGMGTVLATIVLDDPCAPAPAGGVLTLTTPRSDVSADASGTPAAAVIKDSDGTTVVSGLTVGTAGTDIILDSGTITAGQQVTLQAATITHG